MPMTSMQMIKFLKKMALYKLQVEKVHIRNFITRLQAD